MTGINQITLTDHGMELKLRNLQTGIIITQHQVQHIKLDRFVNLDATLRTFKLAQDNSTIMK